MNRIVRVLCILLFSVCSQVVAQNSGTGLYPFGSFDSRGFDSVNIGNLNTHFEIPIVNKPGRGQNFNYILSFDGLIWSAVGSSGTQSWVPDSTWGMHGQLNEGLAGYVTYKPTQEKCLTDPPHYIMTTKTSGYAYYDAFGQRHSLPYFTDECLGTPDGPITVHSPDGSGYSFDGTNVYDRHGNTLSVPVVTGVPAGGASITDTNGNTINSNGGGTFVDTLGVTALTITGGGTASSPRVFTYNVAEQSDGSTTASITMSYVTYTVQTNFGCSGIGEYGSTSVDLADRVTLADGTFYQFTYEPTPGVAGAVTGRLASVTLPTGGTISYSYTAGCGAGINPDGTVGSLERTTSDGNRLYTRGPTSGGTYTNLQDEKGNGTLYQFVSTGGLIYETHRQVYQGPVVFQGTEGAAPNLFDQYTCYNGSSSNCDGVVFSQPITQINVTSSYNNGSQLSVNNTYDASGSMTSSVYSGGATLQKQTTSYNALEEPLLVSSYDGSSTLISQTTYAYDEYPPSETYGLPQHNIITTIPGNQTSSKIMIAPGSTINTNTSYDDAGVPSIVVTPNGGTGYGHDPTDTFVTNIGLPTPSSGVSLSTSASYDKPSGVLTSSTGMNGGQTLVTQYDRLLRPTAVNYPDGSQTTFFFTDPNTFWTDHPLNATTPAHFVTHTDGYGRLDRTALFTGIDWYQVDYCFDATGLLQFQSARYEGSGFGGANANKQCSGNGTSYAYDALGRIISSTNADGTAYSQYNERAVKTTDVNGVQKITQYDLLGRISGVCEISSSTLQGDSPGSCGMDIAGTGYLTTYSYNLAAHTTTITQGAQTRSFTTDAAGRLTSVTEPERGTTTYSYSYLSNGLGLQVVRTRPKANQSNPAMVTHTTTQYDSVGRVVSITYDDGTPTKNFLYDAGANWAILNQTNVKGMLSAAWIPNQAESAFSYDSMGRVNGMAECLPLWCGNSPLDKRLDFSHDLTGNLATASDGAGTTTTYTYSNASEVTSISSSMSGTTYPSSLVSNVQNGPSGPINYQLGNGLGASLTYDIMARPWGRWICNTSVQPYCAGGSQIYGSDAGISGAHVSFSDDTAVNEHRDYSYDEFNRLTSTSIWQGQKTFSYVYDRYGNRTQQNAPQGGPAPLYSFNKNVNQINGYSYDAAGNMTYDGFHSYVYDAEGNIIDVDGTAGASYVYNALNQRVQVDWPAVSYQYLYNASGQRVSVWDTNTHAQVQGQYYWGNSPIAFYSGGSLHFQHQDWLGTERVRTSYSGSTEGSYYSLPFGDGFSASGADNDPYHFAQLDHDTESWTEHAQFRQYSSTQGRWMSPDPYDGSYDPSNPRSLNRYSYIGDNPLSAVDPSGLEQDATPCVDIPCNLPPPTIEVYVNLFSIGLPPGTIQFPVYSGTQRIIGSEPRAPNNKTCSAPKYGQARNFITSNLASAQTIAAQLKTTPGNILGLSGNESGWGTGFLISAGTNNYFSLTAGRAFGGTTGTYQHGSYTYGTYSSFLASGQSFANSYFGTRVNGITDPLAFAQALNANGSFNSENLASPYAQSIANTINLVNTLIPCP